MLSDGFEPFIGKHCETTALKRVLGYHGLSLSEEMLLGLGGGIGFIYWHMKGMPFPFVGGRAGKGTDFPVNICRRIGAQVAVAETSSAKRGYAELKALLDAGEPAVVYGDIAYLPYFAVAEKEHFGGHVFVVYAMDEASEIVHIYDRGRNPVAISTADLARARGSKFSPFAPKHRLLQIKYPQRLSNLEAGIREGIRECCQGMLHPPIKNFGLVGMEKWSELIMKWSEQFTGIDLLGVLINTFMYIEIAGTGGSAFRTMYAWFLEEASSILGQPALSEVAVLFRQSASVWSGIAAGLLPDSCPNLKRIRELLIEKNGLFEEQGPGDVSEMRQINRKLGKLMRDAVADVSNPLPFFSDVQQQILKCREIEGGAFQKLSSLMGVS